MFPSTHTSLPDFHPQTVIRDWNNGDAFHLSDALTGVCVFGATGSGKTSGPAKHLAYGYLANGFGGLVCCAKGEERRQWEQWADDNGRTKDLVIVNAEAHWRFNFLEWEASRPDAGGGLAINLVAILDEIAGAVGNAAEAGASGSGSNKFWEDALHHMNSNLVALPILAGLPVSLPLMRAIVNSAPTSAEQAQDPKWQEDSQCAAILREADLATSKQDADPNVRADFDECHTYWQEEWPGLAEKTRSIIQLTFSMLARPLLTRPLRQLFSSDTNIKPEDTFDGKIIIVDLPVQDFRLAGRIANLAWKFCFQISVMRRMPPTNGKFLRPVFLWCDEAQNFISKFDSEYQAVARSAGGCTVFLTQNRESYRRVLRNDDAVDSLLGNLQCKLFCQNAGDTNEWAARLLGERWTKITSTNVGLSRGEESDLAKNSRNSGITRSEHPRRFVEPSRFTTLKRGGPANGFQVECIVYNGGHQFQNGDELLPYRLLTFNQK